MHKLRKARVKAMKSNSKLADPLLLLLPHSLLKHTPSVIDEKAAVAAAEAAGPQSKKRN